jgi:multimeric flavodoxin WrbA
MKILAINGAYRRDGFTDRALQALSDAIERAGGELETVFLRDEDIAFCLNCRQCTQAPGTAPARCVQDDGMASLIERIEKADGLVFASPTNFGTVTAVFKRFMERLVVYGYWPWGAPAPQMRKAGQRRKPALLISSSAAPGIMARFAFSTRQQLKQTATTVGAEVRGALHAGLVGGPSPSLTARQQARLDRLARRLLG